MRIFPNLLTDEHWPVSTVDVLNEELNALTAKVDAAMGQWDWNDEHTIQDWRDAQEKFQHYLDADFNFIERAGMLHWRYFDARTPLRLMLLRYRIKFLEELMSHFGETFVDDPDAPEISEEGS